MCATITHNGNGYFMTLELYPEAAGNHAYDDAARIVRRGEIARGTLPARAPKVGAASLDQPWSPIDLGMVILSCERGDVRHSAYGISVYGDDGRREIDLRGVMRERLRGLTDLGGGAIVHALLELSSAVSGARPLVHDGAWGRASLEATLALIASAHSRTEIALARQTVLPLWYDDELFAG